jgi:Methionyl-tRNA synthetase
VALLLAPLLPELSARMLEQLGQAPVHSAGGGGCGDSASWTRALAWGCLPAGQPLPPPQPVMQRLELDGPL